MIISTANTIEKSPTERAKCNRCGKLIKKGTPRLVFTQNNQYKSDAFICYKCAKSKISEDFKNLDNEKERLLNLEEDFNKLMKECSKEVIIASLEDDTG